MPTPDQYAAMSGDAMKEALRAARTRRTDVEALVHAFDGVRLAILASLEPTPVFDEAEHEEAERRLREGIAESLKDR